MQNVWDLREIGLSKNAVSEAATERMGDRHGRQHGSYPKSMATRGLTYVPVTSFVIGAPVEST